MRVTQTKRKCPQCGTAITTNEIDRQTVERAKVQMAVGIGCVGLLVLMYVGMRVLLWVRGEGRVLLTAATYGFERMIGVEFSRTLCQIAEKNVTIFQKRTQAKGHFEIIHSDAIHFSIPAEATVFFFFNPFGESIMNQVLDNISGSLRAHPRRSLIVYLNPTLQQVFERVGITKVFTLTAPTGHEDAIIYSWGNG
jgi:16S rRNA G966 N2-methylase RsmD